MDHVWQIGMIGPPEHEMLEAYTALAFVAACTERIDLMTLVTAVVYRDPGLLAKIVTTLDVLSGGRAWLGIGAAWNEEEARGLGLLFPPTAERFERLEETLQICLQMWSGEDRAYDGGHYHLARTLDVPAPLRRPHPPILIGGSGERKTLRFVAKYAQACNLFPSPDLPHKLDVLREHCDREGRDYDDIQKTVLFNFDVADGDNVARIVDQLGALARLGFDVAHGSVRDVARIEPIEIIGRDVIPAVAGL
jgi:F420-dependent oxidoreductase-like protein